ncbi:MAG: amino acid ABC transporter ATP-binding protein [Verrucomicrobiales bacterium]|nr:amino acid ABC transporter ATP-binding protein [Verrucomicrobiales bacterium]
MDLRLQSIGKSFGGQSVLRDVALELTNVQALVLIGPSGGGKSTLLRMLAGLEPPTTGTVTLEGEPLHYHDDDALRRHRARTGFVFQAHNLFPHLTATENLLLPLVQVHGMTQDAALEQIDTLLRRFHLSDHAHKRPSQLSGGQQQRVAIARAVAIRPRWLLFDEPTSALDPEMTAEVLDMIAELRAEGRSFVLVTHQMGFARRVADHVAFVGFGGIPEHGQPADIFDQPRTPELKRFLHRVLSY